MPDVEPAMAAAFQNVLSRLRSAGAFIRSIDIAGMLARLSDTSKTVMFYEGARFHQQRFSEYGERLGDLANLVREGLQISVERYDEARRYIAQCQARVAELYKATPVILTPAATGPAPLGLTSTGDPRMNAPWTARHLNSNANFERVAPWAPTHRRPRPGCESALHCSAAATNAGQRIGLSPLLGVPLH
jgi:Asp-tRNA(Asn)/Glu-tRNA(Gln) amidotransferase A subunit family amidase